MKKIILSFLLCFIGYPIFAQLPFVSHTPVYADPVQPRPSTPPRDPMDPLGLGGRTSVRSTPPTPSGVREHFGMILGSHYDVQEIARQFISNFGYDADCGGTGNIYQIRLYHRCSKEGASFRGCTIDFYKGKFWQISYREIQNDPYEFADKLERKLANFSVSDTRYEYSCNGNYIEFDGEELRYVNESVARSLAGY